jgi:hypothetical protein
MTFTTYVQIGDVEDVEVEVDYAFEKGSPGSRDSLGGKRGAGPPLEPDDPDEIELQTIVTEDGTDVTELLTPERLARIEEQCWEDLAKRD